MTLKALMKGDPCTLLDVVIVRIIEEKMMIVAENSKTAAILLHDGETKIKEGQSLKIIKPILETNEPTTLRQNPRFKLQIQKNPGNCVSDVSFLASPSERCCQPLCRRPLRGQQW